MDAAESVENKKGSRRLPFYMLCISLHLFYAIRNVAPGTSVDGIYAVLFQDCRS